MKFLLFFPLSVNVCRILEKSSFLQYARNFPQNSSIKNFDIFVLFSFCIFRVIIYPISERKPFFHGQSIYHRIWFISNIVPLKQKLRELQIAILKKVQLKVSLIFIFH